MLPILEASIYDEHVVIASEYAPDGSLKDWLKLHGGRAPSIEAAVEMTRGMLAGLEHLHQRNIIHRDLKPDNILLKGTMPRIADFGISRILKSTSMSAVIAGTPVYMAPEAFKRIRNQRTDIWAVGVMLYQMLNGRLPFDGDDLPELYGAILNEEPDPLLGDVPEWLQRVVANALAKDPAQRYQQVAEMSEALTQQPTPIKEEEILLDTAVRRESKEILPGLLMMFCGLLLSLALLSYHADDPSWTSTGAYMRARNWVGPIGAHISSLIYQALGFTGWLIPSAFFVSGWRRWKHNLWEMNVSKLVGLFFIIVSITGLLTLIPVGQHWSFRLGGFVGYWLVRRDSPTGLARFIGTGGALVTMALLFALGLWLLFTSEIKRLQVSEESSLANTGEAGHREGI